VGKRQVDGEISRKKGGKESLSPKTYLQKREPEKERKSITQGKEGSQKEVNLDWGNKKKLVFLWAKGPRRGEN